MIRNSGLKVAKKDIRDFSHKKFFGAAPLHNNDFLFAPLEIKDQRQSDFCTAFAVTEIREDTEKVPLSPEFQFAQSKQIEGRYNTFGASQYDALKAAVKGALEKKLAPLSIDKNTRDECANWKNWPQNLFEASPIHRAQSYFAVDGWSDQFDSIRGVMQTQSRPIFVGTFWQPEWTFAQGGKITESLGSDKSSPHAFVIRGQKTFDGKLYLIAQNSYGTDLGDHGFYYFPRSQVNKFIFAFAILDVDPDIVKAETWGLLERIVTWLKSLLPKPIPPVVPIEPDVPPPAPPVHVSRIAEFAKAVEKAENANPKWFNPGNLKYSDLTAEWGAIKGFQATDGGYIAKFSSYEEGFQALYNFLALGCQDELLGFHKARTLELFIKVYAGNPAPYYLKSVCDDLKVEPQTNVSTFL